MKLRRWLRIGGIGGALVAAPGCWYYGSCFIAGTRILVPGGRRRIDELSAGDRVLAWDVAGGRPVERPVAAALQGRTDALFRVGAGELLIAGVTAEHPFFDVAA